MATALAWIKPADKSIVSYLYFGFPELFGQPCATPTTTTCSTSGRPCARAASCRAAESLHITPQTISGQIKLLERELDGALLQKQGRRVVPTELGQTVFEYADELFALGQDLVRAVQGAAAPRDRRSVTIGVSDVVPNLVTWRVVSPLMQGEKPFRVICHTGSLDTLVAELAAHKLDLVLSSSALPARCRAARLQPPPRRVRRRRSSLRRRLARRLRKGFPASLDQAPFLLPTNRSPNRRVIDTWFLAAGHHAADRRRVRRQRAGEVLRAGRRRRLRRALGHRERDRAAVQGAGRRPHQHHARALLRAVHGAADPASRR